MKDREDTIEKTVAALRRGRKHELIASPILITIFLVGAGISAASCFRHFEAMSASSVPSDIAPQVLRSIVVNDAYRIIAPIILTVVCLFAAFFLFARLMPSQERKLLLKLVDQINDKERKD